MRPGIGINVQVPGRINATGLIEAVTLAGVEVVGAMRGSSVHGSRSLIGGDVGSKQTEDAAFEERVFEGSVLEVASFEASELCGRTEFAGCNHGGRKFGSDDVDR